MFRSASILGCCLGVLALGQVWIEHGHARELRALLDAAQCAPLSLQDRSGLPLAELRGECAARGHATRLRDVPLLLQRLVIASEDSRFTQHAGVDVPAVLRAVWSNLRSFRIVSGASTLTMQLARLLRAQPHTRSLSAKLVQAWDALTLERLLTKQQILEAYFNLAYYGASANGVADAARIYFGRELSALSDGELALLAVLPRAPEAYNLRVHPERALRRRSQLLPQWLARAVLTTEQGRAIEQSQLQIALPLAAAKPLRPSAQHFVAWAASELPDSERRRGGVLHTTLDLPLQERAEALVRQHVDKLAGQGVEEAAVLVLDTPSAQVRALVGSYAFQRSQVNAITRRRQLGSLLKPFVYGLALDAGATPESIAADVGDVPSAYRSRAWVGREAGPLSYREALAGSYNLAAIHVLERVGVGALHQLLRRAGVAELSSAPEHYGLPLALGSARVRLLDVAAGYGFMARAGVVRRASGNVSLERADGSSWRPEPARDVALLSARASAQVADMLADPAARHRRFGRGLPLDFAGAPSDVDEFQGVALKTGTASGMGDLSAVLVTPEFTVAAWSGRFDGRPTHGLSGMWGALPLAKRVLSAARAGSSGDTTLAGAFARTASAVGTSDVGPPAAASGESSAVVDPSGPAVVSGAAAEVSMGELAPWAERARARLNVRTHAR